MNVLFSRVHVKYFLMDESEPIIRAKKKCTEALANGGRRLMRLSPFPICFQVLTFCRHTPPNELAQFCSLFVLGGAMKYSGLVLP